MEFKGITVGTYISRKPKNKNEKDICTNCEINTKIQKGINRKQKFYIQIKEINLCITFSLTATTKKTTVIL